MSDMKRQRHVIETYGNNFKRIIKFDSYRLKLEKTKTNSQKQSAKKFLKSVFLPHGFPDSVSADYFEYQIWDSVQAFASSITGSVCTHAILKGSGVGDENASAIAATITWLLKDGVSMIGRILFAWFQGTRLDSDCKKWRLFADVVNDIAMFADLVSIYFQRYFLFIACISGLLKSLVGVAGSCTRAALTQHQARQNNMADVSAKDGSQETFVNLLALLCSLLILPVVAESIMLTWILYFTMTAIHLIANYLAVNSVVMETFNEARFEIYAHHFMKEGHSKRNFLSILDVNKKESVFFNTYFNDLVIKLGSSFSDLIQHRSAGEVEELMILYKDCDYLLRICKISAFRTVVYVALKPKATVLTKMEAFYQACFVKYSLQHPNLHKREKHSEKQLEVDSRDYTAQTFGDFQKSLTLMSFNTNNVIFSIDLWRIEW